MAVITIVGSGMMGSALAFPARENGHEVRLVGTHLDRDIIDYARKNNRHPKFDRDFPDGLKFYQIEQLDEALKDSKLVIGGVSSFGVDWFADKVLPRIADGANMGIHAMITVAMIALGLGAGSLIDRIIHSRSLKNHHV